VSNRPEGSIPLETSPKDIDGIPTGLVRVTPLTAPRTSRRVLPRHFDTGEVGRRASKGFISTQNPLTPHRRHPDEQSSAVGSGCRAATIVLVDFRHWGHYFFRTSMRGHKGSRRGSMGNNVEIKSNEPETLTRSGKPLESQQKVMMGNVGEASERSDPRSSTWIGSTFSTAAH